MEIEHEPLDPEHLLQEKIAHDTLERYSGSPVHDYQPYILLTNFSKYVRYFAESRNVPVIEGSTFQVARIPPKEQISILDFKIGSPAAALVVDLCAFCPFGRLFYWVCAADSAVIIRSEIILFRLQASGGKEPPIFIFLQKFPPWPTSSFRKS